MGVGIVIGESIDIDKDKNISENVGVTINIEMCTWIRVKLGLALGLVPST